MGNTPLNLDNVRVNKEFINKIVKNNEYNQLICRYYAQYYEEMKLSIFDRKRERVEDCNKMWLLDVYELQKIKDFKRTNLCKDKFCSNCKKVKQASRMARFIPHIEPHQDNLYLLTLTLPNCNGSELRDTIKLLFRCFRRLIRYLAGDKLIRGIDFSSWGYKGAIRSLEVTFTHNSYHPHIHAGLSLEGLKLSGQNKNTYSYNYKGGAPELKRSFSDQEILIQKIWYLLINGITVTKENIDKLELGYSCTLDKFKDDDYSELFKYMTKETNELDKPLTYDNFKCLYDSLYRVRQIQGYGVFYDIKDEDIEEEVDDMYNLLIQALLEKESPLEVLQTPKDLLKDNEFTLISRKKVYKYLRTL